MLRLLRRVFAVSFFLSVLFTGVSSGSAFASQESTHTLKVAKSYAAYSYVDCTTYIENDVFSTISSPSGNAGGCSPGFQYQAVSPGNNQLTGLWSSFSSYTYTQSCNIDAWFPYGNLSSGTKAHYDFWYGSRWLGWVGHDIDQYNAPAEWNRIATNIPINDYNQDVIVTLHNDGGSGNLAFAAMRFSCS